jgi:hypothetical protein
MFHSAGTPYFLNIFMLYKLFRQLLFDYFTGGGPAVPGSQEVDVMSLDYLPPPPPLSSH